MEPINYISQFIERYIQIPHGLHYIHVYHIIHVSYFLHLLLILIYIFLINYFYSFFLRRKKLYINLPAYKSCCFEKEKKGLKI